MIKLTEPNYICDLCGRENLVYRSTYAKDSITALTIPKTIWGVGLKTYSTGTISGMDNLPNCSKHLCMYCLGVLKDIIGSLGRRGYFV